MGKARARPRGTHRDHLARWQNMCDKPALPALSAVLSVSVSPDRRAPSAAMNRLFGILHRWKCHGLAQKLALDALRSLDDADRNAGLFLWHIEPYLKGVAAPEADFRDFANHVCYPTENWGGAARLARKWYWRIVETLRSRDWSDAAYNAGVLARYVQFAFSPPRTGHDEQGLALCAPLEWWAGCKYASLTELDIETPRVSVPAGDDWLERLVTNGAEGAHCHFRTFIERFEFDAALKRPTAIDETLQSAMAALNRRAAATVGAILSRAVTESESKLPRYPLAIPSIFALPSLPLFWMTQVRTRAVHRAPIKAMHREWKKSGRIETTLPDSARTIRDAYELEVLKKPPRKLEALAAKPLPSLAKQVEGPSHKTKPSPPPPVSPSPHRGAAASADRVTPASPLTALPSITSKLLPRIESLGVTTVDDLLKTNADDLAACLHPDATAADVAEWQDEARLCCEIASLSLAEAQLLAACGVSGSEDLAALSPIELWELVIPVAESPDGRRVLKGRPAPSLDVVTGWIDAAKKAA